MPERACSRSLYRRLAGGHPLHSMVVHFPIAFLVGSTAIDLVPLTGLAAVPGRFAFGVLTAGVVSSGPAVLTGFVELFYLPEESAAEQAALVHLGLMLGAVLLYGINWILWLELSGFYGSGWYVMLSLSGAGLLMVGARFGGELVFTHGVGSQEGPSGEPDHR